MCILFRQNSRALSCLGECSQVQVAVPRRVTSVVRTNEAQARRIWDVFGLERPAGHSVNGCILYDSLVW
jgi:hypothetical protein